MKCSGLQYLGKCSQEFGALLHFKSQCKSNEWHSRFLHHPAIIHNLMNLFDSFQIRDISFRNRIAVSPMCEYSSEDGFANDWHFVHLGSRAVGGAGTVFTEANAVLPEGRISPADLGIWKDAHIEGLARIVALPPPPRSRRRNPARPRRLQSFHRRPLEREPSRPCPSPKAAGVPSTPPPARFTPESIQPEALTAEGIAPSSTPLPKPRSAASRLASTWSKSTPPTAISSTSFSRRWSTPAPTTTAAALTTAPASCARSSRPSATSGPSASPSGSASPPPTGLKAAGPSKIPSPWPAK